MDFSRWRGWLDALVMLCIVLLSALEGTGPADAAEKTASPFRMAFSTSMFSEVNENDVRAAMKVWIMTVANERNIAVDPDLLIFKSAETFAVSAQASTVDGVGVILPEYEVFRHLATFDRFALGVKDGSFTEEYLLLVHRNSAVQRLEQLQGKSLNVVQSSRMSLATIWLDTVLADAHLPRVANVFKRVNTETKVDRVALPVFFGQVDACLMTKASFEVMGELNPQIREQLRVVASSPAVIPTGFAFRADRVSLPRNQMVDAMTQLGETPAGRQILILTQADRIEEHPISCLDESLKLMEKHRRIFGNTTYPTVTGGQQ